MDFGNVRRKSKLGTRRSSMLKSGFQMPVLSPVTDLPKRDTNSFKNPNEVFMHNKKSSMWDPTIETPHSLPVGQEPMVKNLLSIWGSTTENAGNSRNTFANKNQPPNICEKGIKDGNRIITDKLILKNNVKSNLVTKEVFIDKTDLQSFPNYNKENVPAVSNNDICKYMSKPSKCLFKSLIECSPNDSLSYGIKPLSPVVVKNCISPETTYKIFKQDYADNESFDKNDALVSSIDHIPTPITNIERLSKDSENCSFNHIFQASEKLDDNDMNLALFNKNVFVIHNETSKSNVQYQQNKRTLDSKIKRQKTIKYSKSILSLQNNLEEEFSSIIDIMNEQKKSMNQIKRIINALQSG